MKKAAKQSPKKRVRKPSPPAVPPELATPVALLKAMQASGLFSQEKLAALYLDPWKLTTTSSLIVGDERWMPPPPVMQKDATQMVPISNIQASSMTPNFSTLRSFFLSGHQKHPRFPDWITAEEIGEPLGMSADQVKKYSTEYCENRGFTLPNVMAMKWVKDHGGYFMGVQTLVDRLGLPCFVNEELGAAGVWFLMEDGKIVWRNYWAPTAVKEIVGMIPAEKKSFPGQVPDSLADQMKESRPPEAEA